MGPLDVLNNITWPGGKYNLLFTCESGSSITPVFRPSREYHLIHAKGTRRHSREYYVIGVCERNLPSRDCYVTIALRERKRPLKPANGWLLIGLIIWVIETCFSSFRAERAALRRSRRRHDYMFSVLKIKKIKK